MEKINYLATAAFGLESVVKRELMRLRAYDSGIGDLKASDGQVEFTGGISAAATANIWLRCADRVQIVIGRFEATTFDELFEGTKALPWGDWIDKDAKFTVTGKSVKSKLFSVSDCQAIVKKAVAEKLKQKYNIDWFEETGAEHKIQIGLLRDEATLTIDTTGPGLHKRGYRQNSGIAPIKETLASALIELSYWRRNRILLDPLCGSGTIPIEAAMIAKNIAPGLTRKFAAEDWLQIPKKIFKDARAAAYAAINTDFTPEIYGSDISPEAIELSEENAKKAGVDDCIAFECRGVRECNPGRYGEYGVLICNPPYGERIGDSDLSEGIGIRLGELAKEKTWSFYVITSDENFEKYFGRNADAKRKLYNGMIKTDYYQFHGPKPSENKAGQVRE